MMMVKIENDNNDVAVDDLNHHHHQQQHHYSQSLLLNTYFRAQQKKLDSIEDSELTNSMLFNYLLCPEIRISNIKLIAHQWM